MCVINVVVYCDNINRKNVTVLQQLRLPHITEKAANLKLSKTELFNIMFILFLLLFLLLLFLSFSSLLLLSSI